MLNSRRSEQRHFKQNKRGENQIIKMFSSGLEPETFCVLSRCDNHLHHENYWLLHGPNLTLINNDVLSRSGLPARLREWPCSWHDDCELLSGRWKMISYAQRQQQQKVFHHPPSPFSLKLYANPKLSLCHQKSSSPRPDSAPGGAGAHSVSLLSFSSGDFLSGLLSSADLSDLGPGHQRKTKNIPNA